MAPEAGDAETTLRLLQHLQHRTTAHHQRLPQRRQGLPQLQQTLPHEQPLPRRGIRLLPQLWLHHIQRQHRPTLGGLQQGPVIQHAQIALEPHHLQRAEAGGGHGPGAAVARP